MPARLTCKNSLLEWRGRSVKQNLKFLSHLCENQILQKSCSESSLLTIYAGRAWFQSCRPRRLFTVLYFFLRSSRSRALRYGLLTPAPSVHLKIKMAVTVRRGISKRSHEKIGDCEQSTVPDTSYFLWNETASKLSYLGEWEESLLAGYTKSWQWFLYQQTEKRF